MVLSVFDSIFNCSFNCFLSEEDKQRRTKNKRKQNITNNGDSVNQQVIDVANKHHISILPVTTGIEIENLYPASNHVQNWSTFVVGRDKTYILANCKSFAMVNADKLLNNRSVGIMPGEMREFFDPIWDKTMAKKQNLQFFIVFDGKTMFVNTYNISNSNGLVIGATMFIRDFDNEMFDSQQRVSTGDRQQVQQVQLALQEQQQLQSSLQPAMESHAMA